MSYDASCLMMHPMRAGEAPGVGLQAAGGAAVCCACAVTPAALCLMLLQYVRVQCPQVKQQEPGFKLVEV
jgi:hypothetical protein